MIMRLFYISSSKIKTQNSFLSKRYKTILFPQINKYVFQQIELFVIYLHVYRFNFVA